METRLVVAYAIILFMALSLLGIILYATRERRARALRARRRHRETRLLSEPAA